MKLAVCIPCHVSHVKYIPDVLASIDRQTLRPDIVSISISQWTEAPPVFQCSVPVEIHCTPNVLPAADNRNVAANAVLDRVDALSFIDADDVMHPRRIELIVSQLHHCDAVYHSYRLWSSGSPLPTYPVSGLVRSGIWRVVPSNDPDLTARLVLAVRSGLRYTRFPIHAAHGSVRSHVFRSMQFPLGRRRSDDSEYMLMLYRAGYSIVVLQDPLTYFRMGATTLGLASNESL